MRLIAIPYDTEQNSFFFSDYEEYQDKFHHYFMSKSAEEYEIDPIDLDEAGARLWHLLKPNQATLEKFFEIYESGEFDVEWDFVKLWYLVAYCRVSLDVALETWEDVSMSEGNPEEYAEYYIEHFFDIPSGLLGYIDYEKLGRDLELEGSIIYLDDFNVCIHPE
jgi:hypothetical protein